MEEADKVGLIQIGKRYSLCQPAIPQHVFTTSVMCLFLLLFMPLLAGSKKPEGSRQMCHSCIYSINPLNLSMECIHHPNNVTGVKSIPCDYTLVCIVRSEYDKFSKIVRSMYRGCGFDQGENRCDGTEDGVPFETCYYSCEENYCNSNVMGLILEDLKKRNAQSGLSWTPNLLLGAMLAWLLTQ